MTIKGDILLVIPIAGSQNDLPPWPAGSDPAWPSGRYENTKSRAADAEIASAPTWLQELKLEVHWGQIIHAVDENYMRGPLTPLVTNFLAQLYNQCMY